MREKIDPQKPLAVLRIRDVEGGEAGANWNERREDFDIIVMLD